MREHDELNKLYQEGVGDLKRAASNTHSFALRALNNGDVDRFLILKERHKQLSAQLSEIGFARIGQIDAGPIMQQALKELRSATQELREARAKMRSITQAVEQSARIADLVEKTLRRISKLSLPI